MIFSGMEHMKEKPFDHVFIHGIVRDEQGRKMSKSLGNGIDPLEVIDKYGTDALRFTLASGNAPGNDIRFSWDKVEASRNFINKIWNASRFVLMNLEIDRCELPGNDRLQLEDKWILSRMNSVAGEVGANIEKYELGIAIAKLYDFMWDEVCDWYIELVKNRLYGDDKESSKTAQKVLCYVLSNTLCMLHPFIPFITEEIWQALPHDGETITHADYPTYKNELNFPDEERSMKLIMDAIKNIRNTRSGMNVPPSRKAQVIIVTEYSDIFKKGGVFFERLASAASVKIQTSEENIPEDAVAIVTEGAKVYIPLGELVDKEKELERLNKEKERLIGEIKRVEGKLANEKFVSKAPAKLVEEEKEKGVKYKKMLDEVLENIAKL